MTREEAKYYLKSSGMSDEQIKTVIDAFTCEDCISRQAVLDIINFEDEWLHDANSHNADTKIAFNGLESRVKELPSVTPKTEWIPVSERLPEEDGFYLATCDGEICGEDEPIVSMAEFENGKWADDEDDYQCVLAWMPLPPSYQGE